MSRPLNKKSPAYHHGDLRNALVHEASVILEQHGVDAVTLRGLARALGVSHAAPGYHFADREELLSEVAADGFVELWQELEAAIEASAGQEAVRVQVSSGMAYVGVALRRPQRFKLMFSSGLLGRDDCPERLRTESSRAYAALMRIAHGRSGLDIDPATYRIDQPELGTWALVHGLATLSIDGALGPIEPTDMLTLVRSVLEATRLEKPADVC